MMSQEYQKIVNSLDPAWTFTNPTNISAYYPSIKTLTAELPKAQKGVVWELRRDEHEFYLGIEDVWNGKTLESYNRPWLE